MVWAFGTIDPINPSLSLVPVWASFGSVVDDPDLKQYSGLRLGIATRKIPWVSCLLPVGLWFQIVTLGLKTSADHFQGSKSKLCLLRDTWTSLLIPLCHELALLPHWGCNRHSLPLSFVSPEWVKMGTKQSKEVPLPPKGNSSIL